MAKDDPATGDATTATEARELEPAIRDVAYRLTHDLRDTGEDVRDAAAFAPLALMKVLNGLATRVSAHPRKLALGLGLVVTTLGMLRWRSRRRSDGEAAD